MPYGNVSYQSGAAGSGSLGGNPGNVLSTLMMRLMGGRQGGSTAYGSPEGEMAMAQMLGLEGAQGMRPDPRMMGRGMAGAPMPAGGMPPVPMSKPMMPAMAGGMGGAQRNQAIGWYPRGGMGLGGGMPAMGGPDDETRRRLMLAMRAGQQRPM